MPLPPGTQHACRLLHASVRARCCGGARCCALWQLAKGKKKRWGSLSEVTAPSGAASYFFFAFLAFLAAFFAFLAIVPPEGVQLVPDGDAGSGALSHSFILSASQAVV